jgi:hypothetical protein
MIFGVCRANPDLTPAKNFDKAHNIDRLLRE